VKEISSVPKVNSRYRRRYAEFLKVKKISSLGREGGKDLVLLQGGGVKSPIKGRGFLEIRGGEEVFMIEHRTGREGGSRGICKTARARNGLKRRKKANAIAQRAIVRTYTGEKRDSQHKGEKRGCLFNSLMNPLKKQSRGGRRDVRSLNMRGGYILSSHRGKERRLPALLNLRGRYNPDGWRDGKHLHREEQEPQALSGGQKIRRTGPPKKKRET